MNVVIKFAAAEELKALPLLLRHSPGTILPHGTYIVSRETVPLLTAAGIRFRVLATEGLLAGGRTL
jgi:hypothetical protein